MYHRMLTSDDLLWERNRPTNKIYFICVKRVSINKKNENESFEIF